MTDLLKDVRAVVNRHRGRDYAESVQDRTSRERRASLKAGIINTLAGIVLAAVVFAAYHFVRINDEYAAMKENEAIALRTKVADMQTWDCREYAHGDRSFRWCSRARGER